MNNHQYNYYFLLVTCFLLFPQTVVSETLYRNNTNGYEITLPDNWSHKEEDINYLTIRHEDSFGSGCSLIVEEEESAFDDSDDLIKYIENDLFENEGNSSEYILEKVEPITLNNETLAAKIYMSQKLKKEAAEKLNTEPKIIGKEIGVFSVFNNKGYYLSCLSKPNEQQKIIEHHESIINSFDFFDDK